MYLRSGKMVQGEDSEKQYIQTEEGKTYQVTFIVAFVWEKLDGQTTIEAINEQISEMTQEDPKKIKTVSAQIIKQLSQINLLKETSMEASAY